MSDFTEKARVILRRYGNDFQTDWTKLPEDIKAMDVALSELSHLIDQEIIGATEKEPHQQSPFPFAELKTRNQLRAAQRLRLKGGSDERR